MSVLHLCFDIEIAVLYEILFSAQKKKRERERKKLKRHSKLPRSNYVNSCHITKLNTVKLCINYRIYFK